MKKLFVLTILLAMVFICVNAQAQDIQPNDLWGDWNMKIKGYLVGEDGKVKNLSWKSIGFDNNKLELVHYDDEYLGFYRVFYRVYEDTKPKKMDRGFGYIDILDGNYLRFELSINPHAERFPQEWIEIQLSGDLYFFGSMLGVGKGKVMKYDFKENTWTTIQIFSYKITLE